MGAACVTHPLDLAKVRMQTAKVRVGLLKTIGNVFKYEGNALLNCTTYNFNKIGFLQLYSGLSAALLRQASYSTVRFGVYEDLKRRATNASATGAQPSFGKLLGIAMISGCIGGVIGNPADVLNVCEIIFLIPLLTAGPYAKRFSSPTGSKT